VRRDAPHRAHRQRLRELFTPGEHLAAYGPDDLVDLIEHYLAADRERETHRRRRSRAGCDATHDGGTHGDRDRLAQAGIARRDTANKVPSSFGVTAQLTVARGLSDPDATMRLAAERLRPAALAGHDVEASLALADLMLAAGRDEGALAALGVARRHGGTTRAPGSSRERWSGDGDGSARPSSSGARGCSRRRCRRAADEDAGGALGSGERGAAFALGLVLQAQGVLFRPGLCALRRRGDAADGVRLFHGDA
jgi:hypothetical protein